MNSKGIFKHLPSAMVGIAVIGVTLFYKDFALQHYGPLYVLEILFFAWALFALIGDFKITSWFEILMQFKWLGVFFIYGAIIFTLSLIHRSVDLSLKRTFQHAIVFVYPLLWSIVGYWTFRENKNYGARLAYFMAIIILIFDAFSFFLPSIKVIGSLAIVIAMTLTIKALQKDVNSKDRRNAAIGAVVVAVGSFLPFWIMWLDSMQRTAIVILLFMILSGSLMLRKPILLVLFLALFGGGFGIITGLFGKSDLKQSFYSTMQHGEDRPLVGEEKTFQHRTRSLFWNRALLQWKANPIFGIGFNEEVPKLTNDEMIYIQGVPFDPPISGPHNSYLGVMTRMGIIGLLILMACYLDWFCRTSILWRGSIPKTSELLVIFIFINGAIYSCVNVGLESPHNSFLMWLFFGGALCLANEKKSKLTREIK